MFTMTGVVLITSVECSGDHVPVTPVAAYGAWLQLQLVSTTYPRFTRAWALCICLPAASDMLVPVHLPILTKTIWGWLVTPGVVKPGVDLTRTGFDMTIGASRLSVPIHQLILSSCLFPQDSPTNCSKSKWGWLAYIWSAHTMCPQQVLR